MYLGSNSLRTLLNSLEIFQKFKFICKGFNGLSFKSSSLSAVLETPLGVCVTQFMTQEAAHSVLQSITGLVPHLAQIKVRSN